MINFAFDLFSEESDIIKQIFLNILKFSTTEVILTDDKFKILYNNSRLITDDKQHSLYDVLNTLNNPDIRTNIENFTDSNKSHILLRLIVKSENTSNNIPLDINITKIKNKHKKIKGYCVVVQDITQEIKARIQKETFVDIISHDLKTPMRANIQILELILANKFGKIENELKNVLEELLNSCKFMNYMAENLLIKYKNEFNSYNLNLEKYSIIELIKEKCNKLIYILERKKQNIELVVNGYIPDVEIDIDKIGKVINNLIINASEQSTEEAKIKIRVINYSNFVYVSFTDYGYKKKDENLNFLFEEFLNCNNKFRKIGFGLEMYNCRRIIEAHNGHIEAKNIEKTGSSIIFSLPILKELT